MVLLLGSWMITHQKINNMKRIIHVGAAGEVQRKRGVEYHYVEPRGDKKLDNTQGDNVFHYNYVLGNDIIPTKLNITRKGSCSSLLEPDIPLLKELQPHSYQRFEVVDTMDVQMTTLDEIMPEVHIDELIIDVQGGDLDVLKGGEELLYTTKKVIIESHHVPIYKGMPLFRDIKSYLEEQGFKHSGWKREVKWEGKLIFGDAIFIKD